jgi:hypothetical protein
MMTTGNHTYGFLLIRHLLDSFSNNEQRYGLFDQIRFNITTIRVDQKRLKPVNLKKTVKNNAFYKKINSFVGLLI